MRHPLTRIPPGSLWRWQVPSLAVAAICLASLPAVLPLRDTHTLLDLVEAGSVQVAASVLAHWSPEERLRVAHAVGLDYLMNPAYMNVLAIACIWSSRRFATPRALQAGSALAWLCWSVVATNVAENVGLFITLTAGPRNPWPLIVAAAHDWAGLVLLLAVPFSLAGAVHRAIRRSPAASG